MEILDAGSGNKPIAEATILCDLNIKPTPHRHNTDIVTNGKPFICCSLEYLPFKDQIFTLVHSNHVIEHLDNPIKGLKELQRVGKRGIVKYPTLIWELLFSQDWEGHQWAVNTNKQRYINLDSGWVQILKKIKRFLWNRHYRIRLRERFCLFRLITRLHHDTVILW